MGDLYYRYYDKIETFNSESILVSPTSELVLVKNAFNYGIELIREGEVPFIPIWSFNYIGKMYKGEDDSIEFSLNEYSETESDETVSQDRYDQQLYFDQSIEEVILVYNQGDALRAKTKLETILNYWENKNVNPLESQLKSISDTVNQAIITGCSLTTYTYNIAALMLYRLCVNVYLKDIETKSEVRALDEFSSIKSRKSALDTNGTILDKEWSIVLGTIFLERKEQLIPKLIRYQISKEKNWDFSNLLSFSIDEYHQGNGEKSIRMLERHINESNIDPIHDILLKINITHGYKSLFSESEFSTLRFEDVKAKYIHSLEILYESIVSQNEDTWVLLEYFPSQLTFPYSVGKFASGLSSFFLFEDKLFQNLIEQHVHDDKFQQLLRTLRRITFRGDELYHNSIFNYINQESVSLEKEPIYMRYLEGIDNIDDVIAFQETMYALSDAYWSRDYRKASQLYEETREIPELPWDSLAEARKQYVEDLYPQELRKEGMVVDKGQFYAIRGFFEWGVLRKFDDAIINFNLTIRLSKHPFDVISAKISVGTLASIKLKLEDSLHIYNEAIVELRKFYFPKLNAIVYSNLSRILRLSNNYEDSEKYLNTAIFWANEAIGLEENDQSNIVNYHPYYLRRHEHLIYLAQGRMKDAIASLSEQLEYALKIGNEAILNRNLMYKQTIAFWLLLVKGYDFERPQNSRVEKLSELQYYFELCQSKQNTKIEYERPESIINYVADIFYHYYSGDAYPEASVQIVEELLEKYAIGPIYTHIAIYSVYLIKMKFQNPTIEITLQKVKNFPIEQVSLVLLAITHLMSIVFSDPTELKIRLELNEYKKYLSEFNVSKRKMLCEDILDLIPNDNSKEDLKDKLTSLIYDELVGYKFESDNWILQLQHSSS